MSDLKLPADLMTCKAGETLTQDGRCVMPVVNVDPGCKPGEVVVNGRCQFPVPLHNMNCKTVQLAIEPTCLQPEGCLPDPATGLSLLFTLLVTCL